MPQLNESPGWRAALGLLLALLLLGLLSAWDRRLDPHPRQKVPAGHVTPAGPTRGTGVSD